MDPGAPFPVSALEKNSSSLTPQTCGLICRTRREREAEVENKGERAHAQHEVVRCQSGHHVTLIKMNLTSRAYALKKKKIAQSFPTRRITPQHNEGRGVSVKQWAQFLSKQHTVASAVKSKKKSKRENVRNGVVAPRRKMNQGAMDMVTSGNQQTKKEISHLVE